MSDQNMETAVSDPAPAIPDYLVSPDAVVKDEGSVWRYGTPPDYSKTRRAWAETKQMSHAAGSLPQLVENLVKNWETEASFKPRLPDWRTIDHANYSFAMNGGTPQSAEHMLRVGTYNAIICPNEYYSPEHSDFAASHQTFKGMMPTFAWEVIEVYSGPPIVVFKWRHWGEMRNDYVAFNDKGEKVTAKAHGGTIEIFGITVAKVDENVRLQAIDTWMDPLALFRQIAPNGVIDKDRVDHKVERLRTDGTTRERDGADNGEKHCVQIHDNQGRQGSADAVPHPVLESTGCAACPVALSVGGKSVGDQVLPSNEPTVHHSAYDTASRGSTSLPTGMEDQAFENVSLVDEDLSQQNGSLLTEHGSFGPGDEPRSSLTEMMAHERVEEATPIEPTIPDAKRPKLGSDAFEFYDAPSDMILDPTKTSQLPPLQIPHTIDSLQITGDPGDTERTTANDHNTSETVTSGTANVSGHHFDGSLLVECGNLQDVEETVIPDVGEAVVAPAASEETRQTYQEMSSVTAHEDETMMNQDEWKQRRP